LATVAFVVELDVEQIDGSVESLQTGEFLRNVDAEVVGDFDVAAFDDDLGLRRWLVMFVMFVVFIGVGRLFGQKLSVIRGLP
jgi:hypothetical protein